MNTVSMSLGDRSYDIIVGSGVLENLGSLVGDVVSSPRHFFVLDQAIESSHGNEAMQSFDGETSSCAIEAIESEKTISTVQGIWSAMIDEFPVAMLPNGPVCTITGVCWSVCNRFGARASRRMTAIAPAAPSCSAVTGSPARV